jgi:hypothetical protein
MRGAHKFALFADGEWGTARRLPRGGYLVSFGRGQSSDAFLVIARAVIFHRAKFINCLRIYKNC